MRSAAVAAVSVLVLTGMAACADNDDSAASDSGSTPTATATDQATPSPSASASADDDAVEIDIEIDGRDIEPAPSRVKVSKGDTVRLTVTSDVDNELHVHGVELFEDLPAGEPATVTFTAEQTGLFEIETHESPELLLTQLQVQ
jgi:plastocyanin